jgi:hypothetical protein
LPVQRESHPSGWGWRRLKFRALRDEWTVRPNNAERSRGAARTDRADQYRSGRHKSVDRSSVQRLIKEGGWVVEGCARERLGPGDRLVGDTHRCLAHAK